MTLNQLVQGWSPCAPTISPRSSSSLGGGGAAVIAGELAEGDYVVLEVVDTGAGMTSDVLERARDAFFTTKGAGKGTGLGLSTIHDFTTRSGGDLAIESSPGKGTSVRIYLPRQDSNAWS